MGSIVMVLLLEIVFLILLCSTTGLAEDIKQSGPYKLHVTEFKACNNTGTNDFSSNIVKDYEAGDMERVCFTGNISINRDLNDELTTKLYVEMMKGDSWKEIMNLTFKKGCSDTKNYEEYWFTFMNSLNINATDCPIPKGSYSFKCVRFDGFVLKSQKTMAYNRYRVTKSLWDKNTMLGCHIVEGLATPE